MGFFVQTDSVTPEGNDGMKQKYANLLLAAIVCLFLLQRGGLILFGYSHISHPGIDEPVSGVLPCDILDGQIRAPLFTYEYMNRSGDVLLEGLLLVPYFKFLGRSILSTKFFALFSALFTFLCWILFIKKYQGFAATVAFCLLFALPPPLFARLNLIGTNSSHHMIAPLMILQSILLFRIFENRQGQSAPLWVWLLSGILAGFGVYTFYTYIIFLGFCLLFFLLLNQQTLRPRAVILFVFGFAAGFSPWILRSLFSQTGGQFLTSMLKNISVDFWCFIQNFGFTVPHSFGYNYPLRAVGFISVFFWLFILFCMGIIIKYCASSVSFKSKPIKENLGYLPLSCIQGLFCALFPIFFLICLSLSPMHINPFEYWPNVGLFATFGPSDAIRYRWLYILYPFYFAAIAVGIVIFMNTGRKNRLSRLIINALFILFIMCGLGKSVEFYSLKDFSKVCYYKGYHYDLFAHKFILREFSPPDIKTAQRIAQNYPEDNKSEAYNFFGTLIASKIIGAEDKISTVGKTLEEIPSIYLNKVICGIIRLANNVAEKKFQPLKLLLSQRYADHFYENWGFQYLGHKYYGLLVNQKILFDNIPSLEQWFYSNFLDKFKQNITDYSESGNINDLLGEIKNIPEFNQDEVVRGLGMLVGAEMLFDTLQAPDYPLDSRFGEQLPAALQRAFYEGVGCGFAETLCRFWRMLLLPEHVAAAQCEALLDGEWDRCHSLMSKLPQKNADLINRGFTNELRKRNLPYPIRTYVDVKLKNAL
jgi:hypothetical protein